MQGQKNLQTKKQKRTRTILIICIIIAFVLLALIVVMGFMKQENPAPDLQEQPEETIYGDEYLGIEPQIDEDLQDYRNVLLFGINEASNQEADGDATEEQNTASDLLMVTFNKDTDEMKMTSIDGRTYLKIDEDKSDKVSAAYDAGGMDGLIRSLNQNLQLNIREGVALPWSMIEKLVDDIGGIEMQSPDGSMQTLDGKQAVEHATSEEGGGRMQEVLMTALKKAKTMTSEEVVPILDEAMPQVVQRSMNRDQVSALLMEMSVTDVSASISWPYVGSQSSLGEEAVIIPETLTTNVERLHTELFTEGKGAQ